MSTLVGTKSISKGNAHKIAFSGLSFVHIKLAFQRNGRQGVEDVLTENYQVRQGLHFRGKFWILWVIFWKSVVLQKFNK